MLSQRTKYATTPRVITLSTSQGARIGGCTGFGLRENPARGMNADVLGPTQGRPCRLNSRCYFAEEPMGEKISCFVAAFLGLFEKRFVAQCSEMRRHDVILLRINRGGIMPRLGRCGSESEHEPNSAATVRCQAKRYAVGMGALTSPTSLRCST